MPPTSCYQPRWDRLRRIMASNGIDAVVVAENARTRYLTGYQRYFTATHVAPVHAAILTRDAGPFLLVPRHIRIDSDEHEATRLLPLDFGKAARIDAIGQVLREAGATAAQVGIELGFLAHDDVMRLRQRLPACRFVDADPILQAATAVKFPEEIALIRRAAQLVDAGVAAAVAACRPGTSEIEVAAEASAAMLRGGAEFINHMTVRSGPHAYGNHPFPTGRVLRQGDCVQIDIGCVHAGYVSDTNRTKVVGRPTAGQASLLRTGQAMLEAAIAAVIPGASASSIWDAAVGVAGRAGMRDRVILPFVGHGIGLSLHELPFVNADATTTLEPGMVLAIEPGVYAEDIGCSRPEDMVLVTETGAELLTHFPRDADLNQAP